MMKNKLKRHFQILENRYKFNIYDVTTLLTILNALFIMLDFWWAPIIGFLNCGIMLIISFKHKLYINSYVTQLVLIVLNIYFLK